MSDPNRRADPNQRGYVISGEPAPPPAVPPAARPTDPAARPADAAPARAADAAPDRAADDAPARSGPPKVLGFVCEWSLGRRDLIAEDGSVRGMAHVRTIKIPCSGFVKPEWIQLGFESGAQGVFVLGCPLGDCHFNEGNYIISDRLAQLQKRLTGRKTIDTEGRIAELYLGATEDGDFVESLRDFTRYLEGLPELAPPVKKGRGAARPAPAAGAAKPTAPAPAAAAPAAGAAAPAADPTSPAALAQDRIGPSPARTSDTDLALQAPQQADTPTAVTSEPPRDSAGTSAPPASAPPASTASTPTAAAPTEGGERPRKQHKRWEPKAPAADAVVVEPADRKDGDA